MKYGICLLSVVPVRAEAKDISEIVTQLLFGDSVTILEKKQHWLKVALSHDDYEGWIDAKQLSAVTKEEFNKDSKSQKTTVLDQTIADLSN